MRCGRREASHGFVHIGWDLEIHLQEQRTSLTLWSASAGRILEAPRLARVTLSPAYNAKTVLLVAVLTCEAAGSDGTTRTNYSV